jgi:hypothetical protein
MENTGKRLLVGSPGNGQTGALAFAWSVKRLQQPGRGCLTKSSERDPAPARMGLRVSNTARLKSLNNSPLAWEAGKHLPAFR